MWSLVHRGKTVFPLLLDFSALWIVEIAHVPLGIVLILISLSATSILALASSGVPPASAVITWSDEVQAAAVGAFMMAFFALVGWVIIDRLGWAKREERISVHSQEIRDIKNRLEDVTTTREHEALITSVENGHKELKEMISTLNSQLFQVLSMKVESADIHNCPLLEKKRQQHGG